MVSWIDGPITDEETARLAASGGALATSVRELIDAVVRSEVDPDELDSVRGEVEALTKRLRVQQLPGSFGETYGTSLHAWGNAAMGLRNAIAPPMESTWLEDGTVVSEAFLSAAYEGPPGRAHGGVSALILDQALGEAAHAAQRPGFTAWLTLSYRNGTPLGRIRTRAKAKPPEPGKEHKTVVEGSLYSVADDDTETLCVEAEGMFVLPRAVRERLAREGR